MNRFLRIFSLEGTGYQGSVVTTVSIASTLTTTSKRGCSSTRESPPDGGLDMRFNPRPETNAALKGPNSLQGCIAPSASLCELGVYKLIGRAANTVVRFI